MGLKYYCKIKFVLLNLDQLQLPKTELNPSHELPSEMHAAPKRHEQQPLNLQPIEPSYRHEWIWEWKIVPHHVHRNSPHKNLVPTRQSRVPRLLGYLDSHAAKSMQVPFFHPKF